MERYGGERREERPNGNVSMAGESGLACQDSDDFVLNFDLHRLSIYVYLALLSFTCHSFESIDHSNTLYDNGRIQSLFFDYLLILLA